MVKHMIAALMLLTSVSACTISGGADGDGGTSAAESGSQLLGGAPMAGAIPGGAEGAAAAGLTNNDQVELGKPIWR